MSFVLRQYYPDMVSLVGVVKFSSLYVTALPPSVDSKVNCSSVTVKSVLFIMDPSELFV